MTHFTIISTISSFTLLLGAAAVADPQQPEASLSGQTRAIPTVLESDTAADLILVQRRGRGGGSHQSFHSGGHHGGGHSGHHFPKHHYRGYHKYYSYPNYYNYPYRSYYGSGYGYDYSYPSSGSSIPADGGAIPFDSASDGQFAEGPLDGGQSPSITPNPLPPTAGGPGNIQILNPPENRVPLSFRLNGEPGSLPPGQSRDLSADRRWVIEFDRGGQFGPARYSLESGVYTFTATDKGWELFHQSPSAAQESGPSPNATPFPGGSNQFPPPNGNQPSSGLLEGGFPSGGIPGSLPSGSPSSGNFPSGSGGFPTVPSNGSSQR